ncbi:L-type lectin-domain containing receptor kinase IV.1 [Triticum urartu]|uniref:non-specific serine/threonine protein kinase n=1 Tax=Triticum urartu TaxID=4572 RepID=M7Y9L8_TRIUA|nr:L-type lectin-domain containing receptor kinase SIT2-like [Triticum urartu]EMS46773.1 L-type lectin-domain containing receptor kinase IV.1 [Triticum urartu]
MATKLHRSILAYSLCLMILSLGPDHVALCTAQAQSFVYSGFRGADITLDGSAMVQPGGLLQLTNSSDIIGYAFHRAPLRFRHGAGGTVRSFSLSFVFAVQSEFDKESSGGMAFFVAPGRNFSGAMPGSFLGLFNASTNGRPDNRIFVAELDTFGNGEFKDIDSNHVGIDVNGLISVEAHTAGFYDHKTGSFTNLSLNSGDPMQLWVDYDAQITQVVSTLAPLGAAKPRRPLFTATTNLSDVLEDPSFVGFSGASGSLSTLYSVLGWSFGLDGPAPAINITNLPKLFRGRQEVRSKVLQIVLPIATAVFIAAVGTAITLLVRRHRRYAELREDWEVEFGPHRFSYKDLYHATEGFKNKNLLGEGGFGKVYKGVLPVSNLEVAVKKVSHESRQGMKEFIAEVVSIGRLRHRYLVQLLGYCRREHELILVYEYMPNGSLDKYLYCGEDKPTLDWTQRFGIINGIACGLWYLHEKWEKVVIHRDIKASNVLLDGEMNGRLGDFGLARLYDHGTDLQTTHVVGTMGYLAPELLRSGKASPLTDVFAFGTFLLEVACGQRPIKQDSKDEHIMLVDWVREHCHNGTLLQTMDTRLHGNYDKDKASMVLKLGLLCLHPLPSARPSMKQVMEYLDGETALPEMAPTHINNVNMMQIRGFPDLTTSIGTFSGLSGGR